jgi:chaperone required for assembly of F1-ATPase
MTRDDIIRMALEHFGAVLKPSDLEYKLAALVAAAKEQQMIADGWRQCAKGQRTTQYCGLLNAAVKAERNKVAEENAELLQALQNLHQASHWSDAPEEMDAAKAAIEKAIRARGET